MKIAVAATQNDLSADVSYYGGRAPFYVILDENGELIESFPNPYCEVERHAGHQVSEMMADRKIDVVVAGLFGPAMIDDLTRSGIRCMTKSGNVRDAVLDLDL